MSAHPQATPERVIALVAAVAGGPSDAYGRIEVDLAGNRDAYARIVDTLDALAWLTPDCVHRYQRHEATSAWERLTVGDVIISGPLGFTPVSDRFGLTREQPTAPIAKLASVEIRADAPRRHVLALAPDLDGGDAA